MAAVDDPCGDGSPATGALLHQPSSVEFFTGGLLIADRNDNRIRIANVSP